MESTNLFVGNLAPHVDETTLLREFGRFGPIGTVKIMWPRDEEQRRRGKNTGFVAFMNREDAEKAKTALDGVTLHDLQLAVGWGKAVPLPAVPVWPPPGGAEEGDPAAAPAAPESTRQRAHDGPPPKETVTGRGPDVEVSLPEDSRQRFVIDAVAAYVMRDGCEFEQVIMEREASNPDFAFLFDVHCPEHAYYRWRLFSLANGDSLRSWRVDPFLLAEGSNRWVPPPMTLVAVAQKSAAQRSERREDAPLSEAQRERLTDMLRMLRVERSAISDAMVFALDHADSCAEISQLLIDALTLPEIPGPQKVARLFLLSDILHNTSAAVRLASRYRARLQDALPDVFESLQEAHRGAGGRMAQEYLRRHVLKVLRVWRGWYIFSDDFLNGLQATFLRGGAGPAGAQSAAVASTDAQLAAVLEKLVDEEMEIRCKHSGLSRRGGRAAQMARLLALDVYLNGGKTAGGGGASATAATAPPAPVSAEEEERRLRSRQAEMAVNSLKRDLEKDGVAAAEVAERVAARRAQLLAEVEGPPAKRAKG